MRILLVDDDDSVLTLLREMLNVTGYHEITTASSAQDALEKLSDSERNFDFFLIDIQMPGTDGVTLTELIRGTPGYALTPIVMLTAMHDRAYVDNAFKAGATDYVTKPFDYSELKKRIHSAQSLAFQNALSTETGHGASGQGGSQGTGRHTPGNPVALSRTKHILGPGEFENYVLQIARRKSNKAWVYAVKMSNLEHLGAISDPEEFMTGLTAATKLIQGYFAQYGGVGSYRGRGAFLFVTTRRVTLPRENLETHLNVLMEDVSARVVGQSVSLVIGEQVALDMSSAESALESLRVSIEHVDKRHVPEGALRRVARHLTRARRFSEEQRRIEQRAYESMLQHILSDEHQDDWSRQIRQKRVG